jgi:hypothetical protein
MSYALDLMDIGHQYRQYRRLMAHWQRIYPGDIIDVSYDALVHEPRRVAQDLLAALELDWEERCLTVPMSDTPIKTASVWQVREPIHVRSSGRARHYGAEVAELREYLENGD